MIGETTSAELITFRSILQELERRGHRLRYPEINAEKETTDILNLRGAQGSAAHETEDSNASGT